MANRYPAVILLGFLVCFIIIADRSALASELFLLLGVVCCAGGAITLALGSKRVASILLLVAISSMGGFHFSHSFVHPGPRHLANVVTAKTPCRIWGEVADWPDIRTNRTEIKIAVDSILREGKTMPVEGAVLLKVSDTTTALQRGDRVDFFGRVYPLSTLRSSSRFDYARYLNQKGVAGLVYLPTLLDVRIDQRSELGVMNLIDQLRTAILNSLNRNLEPVQAGLASGFLIGETRNIPRKVYGMFRDSGTLHLLAVSGSNVTLVILFVIFVLRPFKISRRRRALILLCVIALFSQLAYAEPSVVRASIMASLVVIATLIERKYDLNQIIALTAVIILMFEASQLFDVGFQLSFITAWGLILAAPSINNWFDRYRRRWFAWFLLLIGASIVAQLFSMPVLAYHFERVPAISVFANLLIVPLVSAGVIGILILLVADLIWPMLGLFVGSLLNQLLALVLWTLEWLGGENMVIWHTGQFASYSGVELAIGWLYLLLVMGILSIGIPKLRKHSLIVGLVGLNVILATLIFSDRSDENQNIHLIDIPGGVAATIPTEQNGTVDLVLTSIAGRDFSINERILQPWLYRQGVVKASRLFVLEADYNGLKEAFAIATTAGTDTVFLNANLGPVASDIIGRLDQIPSWIWCKLLPIDSVADQSGFYPSGSSLILRHDNRIIRFLPSIDKLSRKTLAPTGLGGYEALVIGRKWRPTPSQWLALSNEGFAPIFCSEIELPLVLEDENYDISPDQVLPDFMINLKTQKGISFNIKSWEYTPDL